jgi:hypothetical protein
MTSKKLTGQGQNKKLNFFKIGTSYYCFIPQAGAKIEVESKISYRDAAHKAIDQLMDIIEP